MVGGTQDLLADFCRTEQQWSQWSVQNGLLHHGTMHFQALDLAHKNGISKQAAHPGQASTVLPV